VRIWQCGIPGGDVKNAATDVCTAIFIKVMPNAVSIQTRSLRRKVYIFVGGKENKAMQKSARIIHQALQESVLQVLPKLYHGEFSINHGNDYTNKIREITAE